MEDVIDKVVVADWKQVFVVDVNKQENLNVYSIEDFLAIHKIIASSMGLY